MEESMLSPDRLTDLTPLADAAADYDVVRRAIGHIRGHWREQPEIDAIAEAAGVTPTELHHLFRRWAGITPKAFVQALTLDGARQLLRDSASVLDATYEVGLSGPGRLHDLFVTHEAMSPGEWKSGGEGLTVRYAYHPSPFGNALVMATERGLAGLAFADAGAEEATLAEMKARWPKATYVADAAQTGPIARRIFDPTLWQAEQPLRVVLIGTDWEVRVWQALLKIPMWPPRDLLRHRRQGPLARGRARRRRRCRQEPNRLCRALPSRHRQSRRAHRLSLGPHPQARHARLGGRKDGRRGVIVFLSSLPGLTRQRGSSPRGTTK
jgi:AraC family transcriptional regulator of adaptative response/methylated-DNA-[protein]-cysteine methyltransferase